MATMIFNAFCKLPFETFQSEETQSELERINSEIDKLNEDREALQAKADEFCNASVDDLDAGSFAMGNEIRLAKLELLRREIAIRKDIDHWYPKHRKQAREAVSDLQKQQREIAENIKSDLMGLGYADPAEVGPTNTSFTPEFIQRHPQHQAILGRIHDTQNYIQSSDHARLNTERLEAAEKVIERERQAIVAI